MSKIKKDEIENMSHLDIAYKIIKENKPLKTIDLLKEICNILEYDESAFENLIGEFYTSLNLDKRFILIDGEWDLSERHVVNVVVEDELDEYDEELEAEDEDEEAETIEDEAVLDDAEALEDVEDDLDDEMEDLSIIDEEEMEDEENL